jgi:thymidylate synthase (FAD)
MQVTYSPNYKRVLDHGFVILRNIAGPTRRPEQEFDAHDTDPANAARMSFNMTDVGVITLADGSTRPRTEDDDMKLSEYLIKNWHNTPFEMVEVWLEMKLPIFVARQFVRHRTAGINEVSGRYVTLPAEWYIPETVGGKAANKKQGQEDNLGEEEQAQFKHFLSLHCQEGYDMYLSAIERGVAPEHARLFLSLNHYTHWLYKMDLHNLFNFMRLRDHSHAQIEAQLYAQAVVELLDRVMPRSMALYRKYRKEQA